MGLSLSCCSGTAGEPQVNAVAGDAVGRVESAVHQHIHTATPTSNLSNQSSASRLIYQGIARLSSPRW